MQERTNTATWDSKNKRWRITVQRDGQRKQFYSSKVGKDGKIECQRKADKWIELNGEDGDPKVKDVIAEWYKEYAPTVSTSARVQAEQYTKRFIIPAIGNIRVRSLKYAHLQSIINDMGKQGYAAKTIKNAKGILSLILKWCRKRELTTLTTADVDIPKTAQKPSKTVLSPQDYIKVFESDKTLYRGKEVVDWYINAYRLILVCGLRPGEILGLKWSDIDFEHMRLTVRRSFNEMNEYTEGKNANAQRAIGLNRYSYAILQAQKEQTATINNPLDLVFPMPNGEQLRTNRLRLRWVAYCKHNNITVCSTYELRHTFVSSNSTLPEGLAKSVMGHSKDMDTFGIYGHDFTDDAATAARLIEDNISTLLSANQ